MKRVPLTAPGQTGPRRPSVNVPPLAYIRVSVQELRDLPIRAVPLASMRMAVLDFRLTAAPGMTKGQCPRTYGHGAARLAGFVLNLCVVRDGGQWFFEAEAQPWNEWRGCRERLEMSPEVLADVYRAVQQRLLADEGRAYGRTAGRN